MISDTEIETSETIIPPPDDMKTAMSVPSHQFNVPRISTFFAEPSKGEVQYLQWRYEVRCLIYQNHYSEKEILQGIRRSCKGEAANVLRRLGTKVSLETTLARFESIYGSIDSREEVLRRLYNCQQLPTEDITAYSFRVEEI